MGFNESVHAFIAARYYARLQEAFGTRAEPAFIHAVQYYAGQRGRRMAQRAIREGKPLTHATFLQYGELKMTDEVEPTQLRRVSRAPDYEVRITACPWHAQFARMGCSARRATSTAAMWTRRSAAAFRRTYPFRRSPTSTAPTTASIAWPAPTRRACRTSRPWSRKKDFSYHCGHLYWSFSEVVCAIFGAAGEAVAAGVLGGSSPRTYGASDGGRAGRLAAHGFQRLLTRRAA